MNRRWTALLFAGLALAPPAGAQASRGPLASGIFAVTNVTVVPMTADTVLLRDATVLVRDGRIAAVGRSGEVRVPARHRPAGSEGRERDDKAAGHRGR